MKILQVHTRVNTDEEIKEVIKNFDYLYLLGIYKTTDFSKDFNKKYKLDPSLFSIYNHYTFGINVEQYYEYNKPLIVDFISNHLGVQSGFKFGFDKCKYNSYNDVKCGYDGSNYWMDVFQLDYTKKETVEYMFEQLKFLASFKQIGGVRVDMAHLALMCIYNYNHRIDMGFDLFYKFIKDIKKIREDFIFIAETYTHYEDLLNVGFDYVYNIEPRRNLQLKLNQNKSLVIIDDHDEPLLCEIGLKGKDLDNKLKELLAFKNTFWYLPAVTGYTKRPSANYWDDRDWCIDKDIKKLYIDNLK